MKIEEIRDFYNIPIETLQMFEQEGLFDAIAVQAGVREFCDCDIAFICRLLTLTRFGMKIEEIKEYLKEEASGGKEKRCRLLRKQRANLLDMIHEKQKDIDCLDYLLYEIEHTMK